MNGFSTSWAILKDFQNLCRIRQMSIQEFTLESTASLADCTPTISLSTIVVVKCPAIITVFSEFMIMMI